MSGEDKTAKDKAMAARMKKEKRTPPNHWPGDPEYQRIYRLSKSLGRVGGLDNSKWQMGMLGGVLAYKAGLSSVNPI